MNKDDLLKQISRITWYHRFDFGNGIQTVPHGDFTPLWDATTAFLKKADFKNKTVLDIGCWDGYWSFFAERAGAKHVLATDKNNQRWIIDGRGFRPAEPADNPGFRLAHEVYESKVAYDGNVSVYELDKLSGRFDVVLYLGVYYHLTHPTYAFTQIRHKLNPGGEVMVEGAAINDDQSSFAEYYYGKEGSEQYRLADPSNWFVPSRRCLKDMLRSNYLEILDECYVPMHDDPSHKIVGRYGRMLVRARAVEKSDTAHLYEPQFGLAQYDPRFQPGGTWTS